MENKETVLVTGGSGFIASHCIIQLAAAGYQVKATVRDLSRTNKLNQTLLNGLEKYEGKSDLSVDWQVTNLSSDEGWDAAMAGCDYVLHVASPIAMQLPKDEDEMVKPAVEGTLRVLKAASKAGVKRVVITSSVAAIMYGTDKQGVFNEEDWTDPKSKTTNVYAKSKTLAEQAAWDFMKQDTSGMELSTVLPAMVFGPILEEDFGVSVGAILDMMNGKYPIVPNWDMGVVDVRDVASLELLAMTKPEAAGKRFVCSAENMFMKDQNEYLSELYPESASKIPKRVAPNWLIKFLALFLPALKMIAEGLGKERSMDSSQARNLLGWNPRSAKEAVKSAAESAKEFGLIED